MKIIRSTKCSLKFMSGRKRQLLNKVNSEYSRAVNFYIGRFWGTSISKMDLLSDLLHEFESWFSTALRQIAAREALDMIKASVSKAIVCEKDPIMPIHSGNRMQLTQSIVSIQPSKRSSFDLWLHIRSVGNKIIFDIPIKLHQHFHKLQAVGVLCKSVTFLHDCVQFSFEIETGPKRDPISAVGIDTGINALASLSTGEQLGTDVKNHIDRIKGCVHGSKGQKRASRALRQRIDEVAKQVVQKAPLIVVENLKGITKNTKNVSNPKRRLGLSMRRSIGLWNVSYWLDRVRQASEWNRVSFRSVSPKNTSRECPKCGLIDARNRCGSRFRCISCGHEADADVNASINILNRFLTGPYGAGCKPLLALGGEER